MTRIVVATKNAGKLVEIRELLQDLPVELVPLGSVASAPDVVEDGETYRENAACKALSAARAAVGLALADDSGLEVDALDGAPGVRSARFARDDVTDYAANNRLMLEMLKGVPAAERTARFRCVVVLADPDGVVFSVEGTCEGRIIDSLRGTGGFGYDPLFLPDGESLTFGELPAARKNEISHRGRAFQRFREALLVHLANAG